ncbi:MAG TPA: hypothetical protein DDY82_01280 [Clostridiales bacterium]|nr:hypothetical protein [Clostridiales bacterium]
MITEKGRVLIDSAEKEYFKITALISDFYDKAYSDIQLKWKKSEVLSDFDAFLQSFLTAVAIKNGKLGEDETTLIAGIVKYGTVFQNIDITLFADCNYEMRNKLGEIVKDELNKVPYAVLLSAVIDKKHDRKITKEILNGLIKLGYNLSCMANIYDNLNVIKECLKSINDFISVNSVSI